MELRSIPVSFPTVAGFSRLFCISSAAISIDVTAMFPDFEDAGSRRIDLCWILDQLFAY